MTIRSLIKRIVLGPEEQPIPELGRNENCWCNSGKKYKSCHLAADTRRRQAARSSAVSTPQGRGF